MKPANQQGEQQGKQRSNGHRGNGVGIKDFQQLNV